MAFCSNCKYEYQPGIQICPDCGDMLIEGTPATGGAAYPPDDSWVKICGVFSGVKSEVALGALETSNIPSTLISSAFGAFGRGEAVKTGSSHIRKDLNFILVPREFREEAEMVLEAVLGEDYIEIDSDQR
jgi:hypothetical protein